MPDFAAAHAAVKQYLSAVKPMDGVDLGIGLADAIAGLAGAGNIGSFVTNGLAAIRGLKQDAWQVTPNIHFVQNGHEADSPFTADYFRGRTFKLMGGAVVSAAGGAASGFTVGINTTGMVKELSALGTSTVHLVKLKALLKNKQWDRSKTVREWCELCITMKEHKMVNRGAAAVGTANTFVAIPAALFTAFHKVGVKARYETIVMKTAADIHWRAHQEHVMDGVRGSGAGKGAVGPATGIFHEIFEKRSFTRIFGKHKANELIAEPAGWMALADKLNMM